MSKQIGVTVDIDPDEVREWAERHADAGNHSVAHILFSAHNLYAGMQEQWAIRYQNGYTIGDGDFTPTDTTIKETRSEKVAREAAKHPRAALMRRYVSEWEEVND